MNTEKLSGHIGKNALVVVSVNETLRTSTYGKLVHVTETAVTLENLLSFEIIIPFEKNGMSILKIIDDSGEELVFKSVAIDDIDLTVRSHNLCKNVLGISTLDELAEKRLSDLRENPHWGLKSELELIEVLRNNGLSFQKE
ncbi:MAG TPA: DNA-directed RNA polymerase subunit alpha C-terminal domain-containing protein [Candidatus Fimivivens sp.]|nr:DNA-directed RNA polymerase subunit alpha C-terminal domain-containing protein [Candidatus Fimivivens sp.]